MQWLTASGIIVPDESGSRINYESIYETINELNPIEDVCSHDKRRAMRDGNRVEIKAHTSQAATMIAAKVWGQLTKCPFENACSAIVCYY